MYFVDEYYEKMFLQQEHGITSFTSKAGTLEPLLMGYLTQVTC